MDFLLPLLVFALLVWFLWWNRSALWVNAAHAAFRKSDEVKTLEHFARAEAGGRLNAETTASYAYLLLKNDRATDADALIAHALKQGRRGKALKDAERRLLHTYRGLVLWKTGHLDEAVELLETLHAEGYRTTALYGNLGFFLLEQNNLVRAEELCTEAAEWAPDGKVILDNLGSLHLVKKEWSQAAQVYGRLLELNPKFPEAWWGAGRAALESGDPALARQRWEQALALPFNALTTVAKADIEKALSSLPA